MRLQILYFAVIRERLGVESEAVEVADGATVGQARAAIGARYPGIEPLLPRVQVAVNRRVVGTDHVLVEGDELALIPPVAGGSGRRVAILDRPLDLDEVIASVNGPEHGALVTFTGTVRRSGQIPVVTRLEYEAHVPMAEDVLGEIAGEIEREWPGARLAVHHRVGSLAVGEPAVVIAAAAPHRDAAFAACRAAIERLKTRAPIWKKEIGPAGSLWVGLGP